MFIFLIIGIILYIIYNKNIDSFTSYRCNCNTNDANCYFEFSPELKSEYLRGSRSNSIIPIEDLNQPLDTSILQRLMGYKSGNLNFDGRCNIPIDYPYSENNLSAENIDIQCDDFSHCHPDNYCDNGTCQSRTQCHSNNTCGVNSACLDNPSYGYGAVGYNGHISISRSCDSCDNFTNRHQCTLNAIPGEILGESCAFKCADNEKFNCVATNVESFNWMPDGSIDIRNPCNCKPGFMDGIKKCEKSFCSKDNTFIACYMLNIFNELYPDIDGCPNGYCDNVYIYQAPIKNELHVNVDDTIWSFKIKSMKLIFDFVIYYYGKLDDFIINNNDSVIFSDHLDDFNESYPDSKLYAYFIIFLLRIKIIISNNDANFYDQIFTMNFFNETEFMNHLNNIFVDIVHNTDTDYLSSIVDNKYDNYTFSTILKIYMNHIKHYDEFPENIKEYISDVNTHNISIKTSYGFDLYIKMKDYLDEINLDNINYEIFIQEYETILNNNPELINNFYKDKINLLISIHNNFISKKNEVGALQSDINRRMSKSSDNISQWGLDRLQIERDSLENLAHDYLYYIHLLVNDFDEDITPEYLINLNMQDLYNDLQNDLETNPYPLLDGNLSENYNNYQNYLKHIYDNNSGFEYVYRFLDYQYNIGIENPTEFIITGIAYLFDTPSMSYGYESLMSIKTKIIITIVGNYIDKRTTSQTLKKLMSVVFKTASEDFNINDYNGRILNNYREAWRSIRNVQTLGTSAREIRGLSRTVEEGYKISKRSKLLFLAKDFATFLNVAKGPFIVLMFEAFLFTAVFDLIVWTAVNHDIIDDAERFCQIANEQNMIGLYDSWGEYDPFCIHEWTEYFNQNCKQLQFNKDDIPEYYKLWTIVNELPIHIYRNPNNIDPQNQDLCIKYLKIADYNENDPLYNNKITINSPIDGTCSNDIRCIKLHD